MGYTHYFTFKPIKRGTTIATNNAYKKAILDCQKIVRAYSVANGGIAGFAAHTEPGTYGGLQFNGSRENAHEDFVLREHYKQNLEERYGGFCKTAAKPYDVVVVACLCVLKHHLGAQIDVASDGNTADWNLGLELARRVLKLPKLQMPDGIRRAKLQVLA